MKKQHEACVLRRNNNNNKRPPCVFLVNNSKVTMMLLHLLVTSTHGFLLHQTTTTTQQQQQRHHHHHVAATTQKTALYGEKDGPWWSEYMEVSDGAVSNKGAPDPFERMRQRPPRTSNPDARAVNFGPDFTGDPTPSRVDTNSYREESDTAYRAAVTRSNNVPSGDDDNNIPASFRAEEQDSSKWSSFMTVSDGPDPVPDPVQRRYQEDLDKQREQERQQFEEEWKQQFPNQPVPPPPPSSSSASSKKNDGNNNKNQQQQGQYQQGPFANNNNPQQQQQYPQNPYAQQPYMGQYPYMNNMDPYGQQQQQQQFGQQQQPQNYWDPYGQPQNSFVPPPGPFQQIPFQQQPFTPGPYAPPQTGTNDSDSDRARSVVQQRMQAEMAKFEQEQRQQKKGSSMASDMASPNGLWSPGTESTTPPPPETNESSGWAQYMSVSDGPEPTEYYPKSKGVGPREQQYFEPPPPPEEEEEEEPIVMARSPDRPQSLWEGQTPPPSHGGNKYANNDYGSSTNNSNSNNQDPWLAEQTQQQQQLYWQAQQQQQQQWQQAMQQRALEEERRAAHMSVDNSPQAWEQAHSKARERQKRADRMAQFKAERARQEETLKELEKARAIARYRVLRTRLELERRVQAEEAARARAMAKIEADERARRRASRDNVEELARREAEEKALREADKKIRQERERLRAEELTKAEAAAREWEAAVARARAKILAEEIVKRERAKKAEQEIVKKGRTDAAKVKRNTTNKKEDTETSRKRKLDRPPSVLDAPDWKAKKSEVFNGARELYEEDFERPKKVEAAEDHDEEDFDDSEEEEDRESFEDDEDDFDDPEEDDMDFFEDDVEASTDAEEKQHRALLEAHLANEEAEKAANSAKKSTTESKPAPVADKKSQPSTRKGAAKRKYGSQSVVKFFDAPLVASNTQKKSTSPSKKDQPTVPTKPESVSAADKQGPLNEETKPDEGRSSNKEYFANRIEESRKRALLASIQAVIESKPDVAEKIHQLIDSVEKEAKKANDNSNVPSFESKKHFASRIEESRKRALETSQRSKSASSTRKEDPPVPVDLKKADPETSTNKPAVSVAQTTPKLDAEPPTKPTPQKGDAPDAKRVYASGMTESRRLSLLASIRAAKKPSEPPLTSNRRPSAVGSGQVKDKQGSTDKSGSKSTKNPVVKDDLASSPASSVENLKLVSGQKTFLQAVGNQKNGKASVSDDQATAKAKNGKSDDSSKATSKNGTKGVVKNGKEQAPKKT